MTVPALTTADIATFAYYLQTGCTYVQLADVLPILHSYQQHAEYVDGTIKIRADGGTTGEYVLVNVRIRADGWIMAWFPRTLMTGTADSGSGKGVTDTVMQITRNGETSPGAVQGNELSSYIFKPTSGPLINKEYTIHGNGTTTISLCNSCRDDQETVMDTLGAATYDIIQSRGNLLWWGHTWDTTGNPASQTTTPGRALYEMWEALRANQQGGSGAALSYGDVGYWDYELTSATHLYIFGYSGPTDTTYFCTIPSGITVYSAVANGSAELAGGAGGRWGYFQIEGQIALKCNSWQAHTNEDSEHYFNEDFTSLLSSLYGVQKELHASRNYYNLNTALILLTSG